MLETKELMMVRNRWILIFLSICAVVILVVVTLTQVHRSQAVTAQFGCPQQLTVRTAQDFYITVVISDVLDLYAWQSDLTYNTTYLAYRHLVVADFMTPSTSSQYQLDPVHSSGLLDNLAVTRLSQDAGIDGSGHLFYVIFQALNDTGTGYTSPQLENSTLVDRNALEIEKTLINSGNCRVYIDDDAPILEQLPIGETIFLPLILR